MNLELEPLEIAQVLACLQQTSNQCLLMIKKIQDQCAPPAAAGPGVNKD